MKRAAGAVLMLVGMIAAVVYAVGLADPAGAQLADDNNPFGTSPSWQYGAIGLILSLAAAALGAWLAVRRKER